MIQFAAAVNAARRTIARAGYSDLANTHAMQLTAAHEEALDQARAGLHRAYAARIGRIKDQHLAEVNQLAARARNAERDVTEMSAALAEARAAKAAQNTAEALGAAYRRIALRQLRKNRRAHIAYTNARKRANDAKAAQNTAAADAVRKFGQSVHDSHLRRGEPFHAGYVLARSTVRADRIERGHA